MLAMSDNFRNKVEDRMEDIWKFVTNKVTGIVRGFRVQPEVDEPIDDSLVIHRTVFVRSQSGTGCLPDGPLPNQPFTDSGGNVS